MAFESLIDFADEAAREIGQYMLQVTLRPEQLVAEEYPVADLNWDSVKYGPDEVQRVPDDKRGIYAFAICHNNSVLPPYGYILYIGIAGRRSNRSLRERYKDYLNERKVIKRERIARMIGNWHSVLRFFYAPIPDDMTSEQLEDLEKRLNNAFLPPFSEGDLDADVKRKRRAFR